MPLPEPLKNKLSPAEIEHLRSVSKTEGMRVLIQWLQEDRLRLLEGLYRAKEWDECNRVKGAIQENERLFNVLRILYTERF